MKALVIFTLLFVVSAGVFGWVMRVGERGEVVGVSESVEEKSEDASRDVGAPTFQVLHATVEALPIVYHFPYGQDVGGIEISSRVRVTDLGTGEERAFSVIDDLLLNETLAFIETLPSGVTYRAWPYVLPASTSTGTVWGMVELLSQGDPPIPSTVSFFEISVRGDWQIQVYPLPEHVFVGKVIPHFDTGYVLYEDLDEGLRLNLYDWHTRRSEVIVAYSESEFEALCSHAIEYIYDMTDFYGTCGQERAMDPQWIDGETFAYRDLLTGEQVVGSFRFLTEEE